MKTITGHLTAGNKKAIKAIMASDLGLTSAKVGRTDYHLKQLDHNLFQVLIINMQTQTIGDVAKPARYISTFSL